MSDAPETAAVAQDSLPLELEHLPEYHGRRPIGQRTSLTGAGTRIEQSHTIGDRVVLVVEAKVKAAGHTDTDDGLLYLETLKVADLFEVEPHAAGRLLAVMRQKARARADAGKRTPLAGAEGTDEADLGEVGYTDGSGVVLTPKELAELRGDPTAAVIGDTRQAVIVYDDQSRALWPDEFEPDTPRPELGEFASATDQRTVLEVLDGQTGEPLVIDGSTITLEPGPEVESPLGAGSSVSSSTDAGAIIPEAELPTGPDFAFVDRDIALIRDDLEDITDATHIARILNAERQGRGRALKPRKGALEVIEARAAKIANSVKLTPIEGGKARPKRTKRGAS